MILVPEFGERTRIHIFSIFFVNLSKIIYKMCKSRTFYNKYIKLSKILENFIHIWLKRTLTIRRVTK